MKIKRKKRNKEEGKRKEEEEEKRVKEEMNLREEATPSQDLDTATSKWHVKLDGRDEAESVSAPHSRQLAAPAS
ncbi:hypothetical protein KIN20_000356, partial [Parelaphostrongylus tenuis]